AIKGSRGSGPLIGDVVKGRNPAAERKEAAAAEWAKRGRGRLTLAMLFQDWPRLHLIHRRPRYAAEAVRALHRGFSKHLDRPAEDLDRAAVVHALDSLSRPPSALRETWKETQAKRFAQVAAQATSTGMQPRNGFF